MAIANLDNLLNQLKAQTAQAGATVYNATGATTTPNYGANNNFAFNSAGFYQDDYDNGSAYGSAYQVAHKLKENSALFDGRIMDNACEVEDNLIKNNAWKIDVRQDDDKDGEIEEGESVVEKNLVDAIVESFDSELDLYIEAKMQEVIEKYGAGDNCYNLRTIFGSYDSPALKELAEMGIKVDAVGDDKCWQNRTYTFSLVDVSKYEGDIDKIMTAMYGDGTYDENGIPNGKEEMKILEDANGKKGSIIFSDCLTADGTAQGAELNLSSILDMMGYDLVSKADFIGKEQEYADLLVNVEAGLENNLYKESKATIDTMYQQSLSVIEATNAVYDVNAAAYYGLNERSSVESYMTYESARNKLRSNNYVFGGKSSQSIGAGVNSETLDYKELSQSLEEALERANDMSLTQEEREEAQKEADKIKKQLEKEAMGSFSEEYESNNIQVTQQQFANALDEAEKATEGLSEEEAQEVVEEIADKYNIEAKDILDELRIKQ